MPEFADQLFSLKGKAVVITGGAGYLGSTMTRALLSFGADVAVADIAEADGSTERLYSIRCDLTQTESIRSMFEEAGKLLGKIDVLVNCAAYGGGSGGKTVESRIDSITDEMWRGGIDGTLDVTFRCIREVIPYFDKNGGGNIVNIASMYGLVSPDPGIYGSVGQNSPPTYGAGKAAVLQLTRYCAAHLAGRNIRVNSITPGPFPNPKGLKDEDFKKRLNAKTILGRTGRPEELAGALVLLASNASSFMTGANVVVDGGWTAW
jgi:NAD(P)-dependent dehydrogenase (short-subunit alcohol dehydrogenase family)